jgi:hypothetical protein
MVGNQDQPSREWVWATDWPTRARSETSSTPWAEDELTPPARVGPKAPEASRRLVHAIERLQKVRVGPGRIVESLEQTGFRVVEAHEDRDFSVVVGQSVGAWRGGAEPNRFLALWFPLVIWSVW